MSIKDEDVQRMSQALKSGAKLTSEVCPVCSSPIFEIKEELWCLKCNKKVVKIREESEIADAVLPYTLNNLSAVVVEKLEQLSITLSKLTDPSDIKNVADTISALLEVLSQSESLKEKLRK
ncbi:MAG: Sjogren's syndrome/scleroderma autoantigen 1 family protein [Nitrososphaerota archaeon]